MVVRIGLLSNERLPRNVNWTTLSDPLYSEIEAIADAVRIAPPPLSMRAAPSYVAEMRKTFEVDAFFGMNGSWRPELELFLVTQARRRALRTTFYVDPWRPQLGRMRKVDRALRNKVSFIPYREALDLLTPGSPAGQYVYLPFAADTQVFADRGLERDIDILSMGRRYEPLHQAILKYADANGLNYMFRERTGFLKDPADLGRLASRARYFVCTPTDLNPLRPTGGFSPLVMRYFEGLAAGCRLLGALPKSGEYEALLPREAILEVQVDGSDFAEKFARDNADANWLPAVAAASDLVRREHGWDSRARTIVETIRARFGNR
jgi:hypothetical protein